VAKPKERLFLSIVFVVGVGGPTLSLIGGDFFRNVLIVDIQAWRATWLLALVAHLFVAPIIFRIPKQQGVPFTNAAIIFALAIGLFALSNFFGLVSLIAASFVTMAMLVLAGIIGIWEKHKDRTILFPTRVLVAVFVGSALGASIILFHLAFTTIVPGRPDVNHVFRHPIHAIALTVIALSAIGALLVDTNNARKRGVRAVAILCLAIALATVAGFGWDQRTPWTKFIDTTERPPDSLRALLPGEAPIYWEDDVTVPWFLLKRPSYFSCEQGTGVLFSRATAINYQRRYESFRLLRTLDFEVDPGCPPAEGQGIAPLTLNDLSSICNREPGLAALVLTQPVIGVPGRIWVSPVKFDYAKKIEGKLRVFATDKFYIYSCSDVL